jgi:hypothetical protein
MPNIAKIGDNSPPDPIDDVCAPYDDFITEAANWLDGEPVDNEDQMKAVDLLTKHIKAAIKDVKAGEESEAKPVYDQWKGIKARWKPTIDDLSRIRDGLVAINAAFKKKLAAIKEAERRAAWEAAENARREAEEKARQANAADINAQREAAAAQQAALDAEKAALAQSKDTVKGMRKVHKYEIEDHREALHWIAANDREAITAFIEEYVRKNHKIKQINGVKTWIEKEAF